MKKLLLAAMLAFGASLGAQAADTASPFRFLVGTGVTTGGETLYEVEYENGSSTRIRSGGLIHFYGGGEYRMADAFSVQATIGYHFDRANASNGSLRFERIPLDLLGLYRVAPNVRIGAGIRYGISPRLKGTGVASDVDVKTENSLGAIVEGEYLVLPSFGVKLRYVAERFKPKDSRLETKSGNHVGLMASFYF